VFDKKIHSLTAASVHVNWIYNFLKTVTILGLCEKTTNEVHNSLLFDDQMIMEEQQLQILFCLKYLRIIERTGMLSSLWVTLFYAVETQVKGVFYHGQTGRSGSVQNDQPNQPTGPLFALFTGQAC